jgi:hypothetical protein
MQEPCLKHKKWHSTRIKLREQMKILTVIAIMAVIATSGHAAMYKVVDQNGNVSYTNITPSNSANIVKTSKEYVESPEEKALRLEKEKIQKKEKAIADALAARQRALLQEQKRMTRITKDARDRQRQMKVANAQKKQEQIEYYYQRKLDQLEARKKQQLDSCWQKKHNRSDCLDSVNRKYYKKIQSVKRNPEKPYNDYIALLARSKNNTQNTDEVNQHTIINGEWDTQGRHYTPAGGGNAWRDDGAFMQKAAGGYINTQTGQFIPAQ